MSLCNPLPLILNLLPLILNIPDIWIFLIILGVFDIRGWRGIKIRGRGLMTFMYL